MTHAVATLAQVTRDKFAETHIKKLEQVVRDMQSRDELVYHPMWGKDLEIVICVDAAYANNAHYSSQIGVLALLRDTESNKCEVLHHLSKKSRRVCRAVLSAEFIAMLEGFDVGYTCKEMMARMLGRELRLTM